MTVRELIAKLQDLDGDLLVVVQVGKNELGNGLPAGVVEVIEGERWKGDDTWIEAYLENSEDYHEYRKIVNITN